MGEKKDDLLISLTCKHSCHFQCTIMFLYKILKKGLLQVSYSHFVFCFFINRDSFPENENGREKKRKTFFFFFFFFLFHHHHHHSNTIVLVVVVVLNRRKRSKVRSNDDDNNNKQKKQHLVR
jgi:hypothetical protein